jgi:preprotein translocase subunit SecG
MLFGFLLVLLVIVSLVLVAAVLLQSGKGGGVAASFGGVSSSADAFIGTRQAGNLLTKVSWWGGGVFLFLAFVLQILSSRAAAVPESVLDRLARQAAPPATAPAKGGAVPAAPLEPATKAPATPAPTTTAAPAPATTAPPK